jgi:glycosyltransferase involved in cell wall biosynthesis
MTQKSILFIGQSAGRTGAPIILLSFLKWFQANCDLPFQILLREGGELEPEFRSLAPVTTPNAGVHRLLSYAPQRFHVGTLLDRMDRRVLAQQFMNSNIGLIYSNTATNGQALDALSFLGCPVISHIHELEYWIQHRVGLASFDLVKRYTQQYIAVSAAVKSNLIKNHSIAENQIELVYESILLASVQAINLQQARARLRNQLDIPSEALIVGAAGTTDWRKGPDLFIELARMVCSHRLHQPTYFVWVGGPTRAVELTRLRQAIATAGLFKYVKFIGARPDPLNYFAAFDVFTLTSRSDPFPLVVLESAALGKPVVCFDGTGGAREFVSDDCGFVVPHLDVRAMADAVTNLLDSPELRDRLGRNAKEKVQEYDVAVAAPKIWSVIQRFYRP